MLNAHVHESCNIKHVHVQYCHIYMYTIQIIWKNLNTWTNFYFDVDLTIWCSYSLSRWVGISPTRRICFERWIKTFARHFIRFDFKTTLKWLSIPPDEEFMCYCLRGKTVEIYLFLKFYKGDKIAWSRKFCLDNIVRRLKLGWTNLPVTLVITISKLWMDLVYFLQLGTKVPPYVLRFQIDWGLFL